MERWLDNRLMPLLHIGAVGLRWVVRIIAVPIYGAMHLLQGFLLSVLAVVFVSLLAASGFFWIAGPRHFPYMVVFFMMAACCMAPFLYSAILSLLRYAMRLPDRSDTPSRGVL